MEQEHGTIYVMVTHPIQFSFKLWSCPLPFLLFIISHTIEQNAYRSRDIYLQWRKNFRSVVLATKRAQAGFIGRDFVPLPSQGTLS